MCGRATLITPGDELREQLDLEVVPTLVPRFNIAPSQPIAVIKTPRILSFAAFGLSSFTGKPGRTINLRAESLPNMPAYRDGFARHRCLVVVDGFFEWLPLGEGKARRRTLQAFHIRREDSAPFTLAGVWNTKPAVAGQPDPANDILECAIVTGAAAGVVSNLHDRMPVIIAPDARALWLSGSVSREDTERREALRALLSRETVALGARDLVAIPVGPRVNSPAHDDEEVLTPTAEPRRV